MSLIPIAARRTAAAVIAAAAGAASGGQSYAAEVALVATVGMVADVAAEVGGDCVSVATLIGPGIDPHLYRAAASDVARLQAADGILFVGLGLEGQLGGVLERLGETRPTLAVGPAAASEDELIEADDLEGVDPHLWMDPRLWARTAPAIADFIAPLAPDCAGAVAERADAYAARLEALAAWVAEAAATIPPERRVLVTAHDAFGYYAREYDFEQVAIQGISTEAEASIADIRDTARIAAERQVPAIFVETTVNPRTVEAVIEAAADRGHALAVGGALYSDAMGEAGTAGGTYIGMIHENTRAIVTGLGGSLPPLPPELGDFAAQWGLPAQ